jgi:deoxyribonuclease V
VKAEFSTEDAHKKQVELSRQIIFQDKLPQNITKIAGVDVAYEQNISIGATVVLDHQTLELCEFSTSQSETEFPYIPTLLSFREIRPALMSIRKIRVEPDVFLVDGQGFAHPYGCGFACHLGLIIKKPTIGVAKTRLIRELCGRRQGIEFLRFNGKIVGAAVTTKKDAKPVYVSVGHMISLATAIRIVKHCSTKSRIPEPILKAHEIATEEKRKLHIHESQQKKCETQSIEPKNQKSGEPDPRQKASHQSLRATGRSFL